MTTRRQQGYAAGRDDALASRIDRPGRYKDDSFREGYVAGYEAHRPVEVRQVALVPCAWHYDYSFRVVARFRAGREIVFHVWVTNGRWVTDGNFRSNPDWPVRRRLLAAWIRRFWLSLPVNFRGLAVLTVRHRHPKYGHRNPFQDYLDETDHPLADYLRCAWTVGAWPLHPLRVPGLPHADFHPALYLGQRHWVSRVHSHLAAVTFWEVACGHTDAVFHDHQLGPDGEPPDIQVARPCATCYRIRPLPGCQPIQWD